MSWKHVRCALAFTILGAVGLGIGYLMWTVPLVPTAFGLAFGIAWAIYTAGNCLGDYFDGKNK